MKVLHVRHEDGRAAPGPDRHRRSPAVGDVNAIKLFLARVRDPHRRSGTGGTEALCTLGATDQGADPGGRSTQRAAVVAALPSGMLQYYMTDRNPRHARRPRLAHGTRSIWPLYPECHRRFIRAEGGASRKTMLRAVTGWLHRPYSELNEIKGLVDGLNRVLGEELISVYLRGHCGRWFR